MSKRKKGTPPITRFFHKTCTSQEKENFMPLKGKREAPGSREGSPKRKMLKTEEEEAWSTTPIDPLADSVIFVSEVIPPSAGLKLVDLPMKKHRCSVLTSIGSDLEMTEDIPVDKSRLPDFLHTPPPFSSSESSDDDLKPVNFRTPINKRPSSHDFDKRLSHFKSEEKLEYSLKRACFENNLSPVEKSSYVQVDVDKHSSLTNTDPVQSPVVASFEDGGRVLPPLKLEYDMSPPYERDLEFLVITNGLVSLSISKDYDVVLFNPLQRETLSLLLTKFSISMRLNDSIDYLLMLNTTNCMIPGSSLIELWTVFMETKVNITDDHMHSLIVEYFQSLITIHPPTQSNLVHGQYLSFLQSIQSSFLSLLMSRERWKVELLSVIVSLLLSDYYHQHKDDKFSSPFLFISLFWKSGSHFINNFIRQLVQDSLDVYNSQDNGYIKTLQVNILSQLFFLIFTECEDVGSDLSIAFSSLPPLPLFTALSSLQPFKLREYVSNNVHVAHTESLTSHAHESIKLYLLFSSLTLKH